MHYLTKLTSISICRFFFYFSFPGKSRRESCTNCGMHFFLCNINVLSAPSWIYYGATLNIITLPFQYEYAVVQQRKKTFHFYNWSKCECCNGPLKKLHCMRLNALTTIDICWTLTIMIMSGIKNINRMCYFIVTRNKHVILIGLFIKSFNSHFPQRIFPMWSATF